MSVAFLLVVFVPPIGAHLVPVTHILALRISLLNFFLAAICVLSWRLIQLCTALRPENLVLTATAVARQLSAQLIGCTAVVSLTLWSSHPHRPITVAAVEFWLLAATLMGLARAFVVTSHTFVRPRLRRRRQVILVGSGPRARETTEQLLSHPRWKYHLLGYVDSDPQPSCADLELLGGIDDLKQVIMRCPVDEVIIALPVKSKYDDIQMAITVCEEAGVQSRYSVDLFSMGVTKRRSLDEQDNSSVILHMVHNDHRRVFKRALDLVGACFGLVVLSPLLLLVALVVKSTSRGPVVFQQQRFGLNKRQFTMYKFRSMVVDAEKRQSELDHLNEVSGPVFKMHKDPRITPIGRLIRRSSIDELPQLLNVLRGDMSLVGPRPLPMRDVGNFSEARLMRRFSVKPGLTGLWQVSGRSNSTFANWMRLDLEYIDGWTLMLDVKILARTFPAVLKRDGAA